MGMKSLSCSHIKIEVNKNYLLKNGLLKPTCIVSRENLASRAPVGLKNQQKLQIERGLCY
jgi:hypothetical protein